jgi:hypothetical protein
MGLSAGILAYFVFGLSLKEVRSFHAHCSFGIAGLQNLKFLLTEKQAQCRNVRLLMGADHSLDYDDDELSDEELEATVGTWDEKIARFNSIQLTGRVGNTPEARYFDDGKVVVNLSLASRRKYHGTERKTKNIKMGEEETDWYGLEIWVSL